MRFLRGFAVVFVACFMVCCAFAQQRQKGEEWLWEPFHGLSDPFYEGCCVNPDIPRPKNFSHATAPAAKLLAALHCATNNDFAGGTRELARDLGDGAALHVAYYYGGYMSSGADAPLLTVAVYSVDGKHGVLFDGSWESSEYFFWNLPPLLRKHKQWRVGEIHGGLWSYTRLWYLAQEIGSRPRVAIPVAAIERAKPKSCLVFGVDETGWKANE